jgi:hypothetical protein
MSCPITGSTMCRCDKRYDVTIYEENHSLKELFRKLFTDHAVYTKFYIESALTDQPDLSAITNRLFENQVEIGTNVGKIVGHEKGNKLIILLKQHIEAAANAVSVAKKGGDLTDAKNKIFTNSAAVAKFLSRLSPKYLPYNVVKKQFDHHNKYVLEMVVLHLTKKYDREVVKYDEYYNHMLMFSDMLYVALSANANNDTYNYGSSSCLFVLLLILLFFLFVRKQE